MAFVHDKKLSQLDGPSVYAAWRAQCLRRLASPVFTPLGGFLSCTKEEWHKRHRTNPLCAILCAYGLFPKEEKGSKLCATDIAWVGFSVHADSLPQR